MYEVECRLEVYIDYGIPLRLSHPEHESVLGDTGIVHKDVDTAEISHYLVNDLPGLLKVGSIGSISLYLVPESLEFLDGLLSSLIDDKISESDISSFRSILESYCLSNTSCSSCDESYFSI